MSKVYLNDIVLGNSQVALMFGDGDSYITESSDDVIDIYSLSTRQLTIKPGVINIPNVGDKLTFSDEDTYITESSDDVIDFYVGGIASIRITDDKYTLGYGQKPGYSQQKFLDLLGGINIIAVDQPTADFTLTATTGGSLTSGATYYYSVAYVTAEGDTKAGYSGSAYYKSITLGTSENAVNITGIPISSDKRVIGRKIYRSTANGSGTYSYLLVHISDNTTTSYSDTKADGDLITSDTTWYKENTTVQHLYIDGIKMGFFGWNNTLLGSGSLGNVTTGNANTAFGAGINGNLTTGSSNTYLGFRAGYGAGSADNFGTHIGMYAGTYSAGSGNTNLGYMSGRLVSGGSISYSVSIGYFAGYQMISGNNGNINLGSQAGRGAQGSYNIFIGYSTGYTSTARTVGNYNIAIGRNSANDLTSGQYNILIGDSVELDAGTDSNKVLIGYDTIHIIEGSTASGSEYLASPYEFRTDTINEYTSAAGVTIDGVLVKDSKIDYSYISNTSHASTHITGGTDIIPNFTSTASGLAPSSGGGTTNFLRADGTWAAPTGLNSPLTTKGDIWVYSTADARLPVGTDGQVLSADSSETTGLKWIDAASGGVQKTGTPANTYVATWTDSNTITGTSSLTFSSGQLTVPYSDGYGFYFGSSTNAFIKAYDTADTSNERIIIGYDSASSIAIFKNDNIIISADSSTYVWMSPHLYLDSKSTSDAVISTLGSVQDIGLTIKPYNGNLTLDVQSSSYYIYMPTLPSSTASNILYYDSSTGKITYGAAPSGGVTKTGSPASTNLTYWSGTDTITGVANFKVGYNGYEYSNLILKKTSNSYDSHIEMYYDTSTGEKLIIGLGTDYAAYIDATTVDGSTNNLYIKTGGTNRMIIASDGKVGIGESSPDGGLHVKYGGFPTSVIERTTATSSAGAWGVEELRIKTGDDMPTGFGPSLYFSIQDNGMSSSNLISAVAGVRDGADNSGRLEFYTYSSGTRSLRMTIDHLGNVGINHVPSTSYKLYVSGSIYSTSNVYAYSDRRGKTDIKDLTFSWKEYDCLKPKSYKLIDDGKISYGFIAQDVESFEHAVSYDPQNDRYSINYNALVAVNTHAIHKLRNEIKDLRKRIVELENQLGNDTN